MQSRRAAFREISGWHCSSIHSDRLSSERRWKINRENQELEVVEGDELAQYGNKSRSSDQIDIKRAYLNRKLTGREVIFMQQPSGYHTPGLEKLIC